MSIYSYYEPMQNQISFSVFCRDVFPDEHRHSVNVALHLFGVVAGIALIAASLTISPWWAALAFPVVHVGPGLIGHRFFERNEEVGDARITRTDYPLCWFLAANHIMAMRVLTGRWKRRP
jgi:hypothetical protein